MLNVQRFAPALALMFALLLSSTATAQSTTPTVSRPIDRTMLGRIVETLRLSDDQIVAVDRMYDQYLSDWNTLCRERQQELQSARNLILHLTSSKYLSASKGEALPVPEDLDEIFPAAYRLRDRLRRDSEAIFSNLMHEIGLILTAEQELRLERARSVYRRSQSRTMQIYLPEATVDAVELIERVFDELDEAVQEHIEDDLDRFLSIWSSIYTDALEQARVRWEMLSNATVPYMKEWIRRGRSGQHSTTPEMEASLRNVTTRRVGVVENLESTVRRGLEFLEFEVGEPFAAEVREALYRRAYPRTHPDLDAPERFLTAVREMDLAPRLRDGIEAEVDEWQRRHNALSAQMRDAERALRMIRLRGTEADFAGLQAASEHRVALGIARTELSDRLRDQIIEVLPPEHAAVAQVVANEERAERAQRRDQRTVIW